MIQKIFLALACSVLGTGYYYLRKQNLYKDMFHTIDNIQNYNIDYTSSIKELPVDKRILLAGVVQKDDYSFPTLDQKESVLNTYILSDDQDRLWKSSNKFRFTIANQNDQKILIENSSAPVFLYNLKKSGICDPLRLNLNYFQRLSARLHKREYQERTIYVGKIVVLIGKLQVVDQNISKIHPEFILGQNKESLLKHIDQQILAFSKRTKILTTLGTLMLASHLVYRSLTRSTSLPE